MYGHTSGIQNLSETHGMPGRQTRMTWELSLMRTVIFTTDRSAFGLSIPRDDIVLVVLPTNRCTTEKVLLCQRWCDAMSIPWAFQPTKHQELVLKMEGFDPWDFLWSVNPERGVSWFYTMILPPEVVNAFPIVNFHAGDPGPHALKKALQSGISEIPMFWHRMTETVDMGEWLANDTLDVFEAVRNKLISQGIHLGNENSFY